MAITKRDLCYEVTTTVARFAHNMLADTVANHGEHMPDKVREHLKIVMEHLGPVVSSFAWRDT